ncbi:TPA: hypothetical protein HA265_04370, partial [Candidatus Woesearchaeota archaeon]|nr:hypothetical protein [Candidatus Woesearchaeota archaeon]
INLPSPHSVYRDFHQHSRDGRGILAVAFTDSRDDDARNRHMLSMNFYRNIREKLPPEMRSVLRGSERVNSLNAVGFAPQLFLYVKAVEVGHQDDRPIHDYYLWLLDAGTPEGCSVTLPLFGMDSSDARLAFDIYSGTDDKYESVALLRDLFLADMTPHDDCYNWPAISRTLAHRRNSSSFRGFSLDAFLANYFVIGRLLDPAFAGLAADTFENTYARNILAEYREDLQAMQGSVGDDPTVTVHSRVNVSLFQGNKKRVHDAEGNVLPLPKYSPGPDDVRIRHICLGKLDSRPREILVDFGERLDPDFHGEGAERRYSCRLKMTYTPE